MMQLQISSCTVMFMLLNISFPAKTEVCSPVEDFYGPVKKIDLIFKMYIRVTQKHPGN